MLDRHRFSSEDANSEQNVNSVDSAIEIKSLQIPEVKLIYTSVFMDRRGPFTEIFNAKTFSEAGVCGPFVQDNCALSHNAGVIRGLHYQVDPAAQGKLVRVVRGSILDITVDIRHGSPTFGRHVAVKLSAENWQQLWVPVGFAHGYCTLESDTEVLYKVTNFYSPEHERGIQFDDPDLAIDWPLARPEAQVSDKDLGYLALREQSVDFLYEANIQK